MDKYTIYCTEEQTKKALELGAPIHYVIAGSVWKDRKKYLEPTAEQMIGWLETQEILVDVEMRTGIVYVYDRKNKTHIKTITIHIRKESTLAAIDAALNYLSIHVC